MTDADLQARNRYFTIVAVNLAATVGAIFGLVLMGRSAGLEGRLLGAAILIAGVYVMAVVPRSLARRWRTPPGS
ncbi:hypothetical protein DP116_25195 [Brasilonema bromeliae SPC951]|uniref:Major facilitator superfamily (MFS) profile domain-containing protein n=1 Tax=Brasilonema bromeliae SPC951 TaxID=385972 RepID=A0ABX1PE02_9CYAN|nr:hypothetical protein [Brasilonema bromeliae]NMG22566.1 hypothetical protein [Brasilonema bromeliae SPC951]